MSKRTNFDQGGAKNPYWRGGRSSVEFKCEVCGKSVYDWADSGRRFCGRACMGKSVTIPPVERVCEKCGITFLARKSQVDSGKSRFCSNHCKALSHDNANLLGISFTYEHRKKIGDSARGEKNWNWKGGIKSENQAIRCRMDYKDWRKGVFQFDDFTCVRCGKRGGYLHAHHIDGFASNPEFRFDPDNGATLCEDCHFLVHSKEFRADVQNHATGCVIREGHACVL
jgi:hypothetical protein